MELPDLANQLDEDWKAIETDSFGEWFTWMLLARGNDSKTRLNDLVASTAAEGWGGDRYVILQNNNSGEFAIALRYLWDTPKDEQEAQKAFTDWLTLRFGQPDSNGMYLAYGLAATMQITKNAGFSLLLAENETTINNLIKLMP